MKTGLVSVVIPVYNSKDFLIDAVDSVLRQTYADIELIIVDDGSSVDTRAMLKRFEGHYTYIFQENRGTSVARNKGIKAANGEYIAFLDQDDLWLPEKTALQVEMLKNNPAAGAVGCQGYDIDEDGGNRRERERRIYKDRAELLEKLMIHNVMGPPSMALVRAECFSKIGLFDEGIIGCEDRDLWFRIVQLCNFPVINKPLYCFRFHGSNSHNNVSRMKINQKKFIRKNLGHASWRTRMKAYSFTYLDAAREYSLSSCRFLAFVHACVSVFLYPLKTESNDNKYSLIFKLMFPSNLIVLAKKN